MSLPVPTPSTRGFERSFPTPETAERIYDEQDLQRAAEAYRFFYPTVSVEAIFNGGREIGIEDGKSLMALCAGPRHVAFTANSDTPYASGVLDLRAMGPIVVDLPSGPYMGLINDHHQRWVVDMGIPGPDAGQGGKYLILPPGHTGKAPAGYHVARCDTHKALIALRALPLENGTAGALEALRSVKIHPLDKPSATLAYVDTSDKALDATPLRWENSLEYWARLHAVLEDEPVLDEFRPMYGVLAALGIPKGKRFAPDARMRKILERAAALGLAQMRIEGFASLRPDRVVWPDRNWEWVGLVTDNANFESKDYIDLQARDRWFIQAIIASPAMFRRQAGGGSVYFLAARDQAGAYLDGSASYKLTIPQPIPAKLFWSVTAYDARTRSQVKTPRDKAVLGSLFQSFEANPDGTIDLYFGPRAPERREGQWIQTPTNTGIFLYFRIYGPEAPSLDGTWKPSDLIRIDQ